MNEIKDKILKIIELSCQLESMRDDVEKAVKQTAVTYAKLEDSRYGRESDTPNKVGDIDEWFFTGENIYVRWSTSWGYGGHADGSFRFPAKYVYDEEAFAEFSKICRDTETAREELKEQKKRIEKVRQLEQLKRELGV